MTSDTIAIARHSRRAGMFIVLLALAAVCTVQAQDNTAVYRGTSVSVLFRVPGGQQIHSVSIEVNTNQTAIDPGFRISDSVASAYTTWPLDLAVGVGVDTDAPPTGDAEWRIDLTETSPGVYLLQIAWNPRTGLSSTYGVALSDETWQLDMTMPSTTTFDITATETRNRTAVISPNPVDLYRPPMAMISSPTSDQTIATGGTVNFAGNPTIDSIPSPGTVSHEWVFQNETSTTLAGQSPGDIAFTNSTTSPEVYAVTYTVQDSHGNSSEATVNITVNPAPPDTDPVAGLVTTPSANSSNDPWIVEGPSPLTVDFDASSSTDDGSIAAYNWDLGPGQPAVPTANATAQATYLTGEHTVTLSVEDNTGHTSQTITVLVRAFPNQVVSFPVHRGVPYNPNPPTVDGELDSDVGWRGAQRITFGSGAEPADLAFQALRNRTESFIYLSFEVKNDLGFDPNDLVVLTFSPDDTTATPDNDRRLMVFPFAAGHVAGSNQDVAEIQMWRQSAGWSVLSVAQQTALGMESKVKSFDYGGNKAWNLELKIPTTAVTADWVDFASQFRIYFDVIRVTGSAAVEFVWPQGDPDIVGDVSTVVADAQSAEYNPNWWGKGDASGTAMLKGVYVTPADIGTRNTPASKIALPHTGPSDPSPVPSVTNIFDAVVSNSSEMETSTAPYSAPQEAQNVRVRFRIANWGIPGPSDWIDIPADTGPGTPAESEIDPAMAAQGLTYTTAHNIAAPISDTQPGQETFTVTWTLTLPDDQAEVANYLAHSHQCMLVILDSLGGIGTATNIFTSSVYRNMNFGNASDFSQAAEISTHGYGSPPEGFDNQRFLIVVSSQTIPGDETAGTGYAPMLASGAARDSSAIPDKNPQESTVEWSAHGYLYTGKSVVINGHTYEIARPVGSFGHYVRHNGEVLDWRYSLNGATRQADGSYALIVPPDSSVTIKPTIRPLEVWPFMVGLSAGTASPIGTLAATYGTGWRASAAIGYRFNPAFMVLVSGGLHSLPSLSGGQTAMNADALAGLRYSLPRVGRLTPYLSALGGAYFDNTGAVRADLVAGAGAAFKLLPHLDAELGLAYHALTGPFEQLVTAELGVAFGF